MSIVHQRSSDVISKPLNVFYRHLLINWLQTARLIFPEKSLVQ